MKKVGILTFHSSNNYGALLQCYALKSTIESLGFNVSIINLRKEYIKDYQHLSYLKKNENLLKKKITDLVFQREFDVFRDKYLRAQFTREVRQVEDMEQFSDAFDAIVVGSDQVWRYAYTKKTFYSFFLDFVDDQTKKISYAASFGLDYFEGSSEVEKKAKELVKRFTAVSVREAQGVDICNKHFGIDAVHVLDPVFLKSKEQYTSEIIDLENEKETSEKYVAYYLLNPDEFRENLISQVLDTKNIDKKLNIYTNKKFNIKRPEFPLSKFKFKSFTKWLSGIKNAEFIITDSFHGLCFSIIFDKQFICIANKLRGASRMESLLRNFGLEDRLVYEDQKNIDLKNISKIDYSKVNLILEDKKRKSLKFLKNSLLN